MPDGRNTPLRILVVEDEALVRLMLADMLAELGHEVAAQAARLDAAVGLAAEADYDLAVLDLNLGHGITYDVADIVVRRGKPLVLSTGYGGTGLSAKYQACPVLQKPFGRDAMARALEASLQQLGASAPRAAAGAG